MSKRVFLLLIPLMILFASSAINYSLANTDAKASKDMKCVGQTCPMKSDSGAKMSCGMKDCPCKECKCDKDGGKNCGCVKGECKCCADANCKCCSGGECTCKDCACCKDGKCACKEQGCKMQDGSKCGKDKGSCGKGSCGKKSGRQNWREEARYKNN